MIVMRLVASICFFPIMSLWCNISIKKKLGDSRAILSKKPQNRIVIPIFCLLEQSLIFKKTCFIHFIQWMRDKSWPNIYYNDTQQFNLEKHGIFPPPFCLNENSILLFWHILLHNITAKRGPTTRQGRIM